MAGDESATNLTGMNQRSAEMAKERLIRLGWVVPECIQAQLMGKAFHVVNGFSQDTDREFVEQGRCAHGAVDSDHPAGAVENFRVGAGVDEMDPVADTKMIGNLGDFLFPVSYEVV